MKRLFSLSSLLLITCFVQNSSANALFKKIKTVSTSIIEGVDSALGNISPLSKPDCVNPPPECPNENITFWYATRSHPEPIKISSTNVSNLTQNEKPWKVVLHGYTKSKDEIPNPQLREAYFKRGEYNIISVDYEPLARDGCYLQAVKNVPLIANCTAQFIDTLIEKNMFDIKDLHIIGFSLGGQISGQISKFIKHGKPGRVTALDPAAPLFDGEVNNNLTEDSASFVDVYHTNGIFKGVLPRTGHVDFYLNGGYNQPGCLFVEKSLSTCSHERAPLYFAESINSKVGFWGTPCNSLVKFSTNLCNVNESELVLMGEDVPHTVSGPYYLNTAKEPPFALGKVVG